MMLQLCHLISNLIPQAASKASHSTLAHQYSTAFFQCFQYQWAHYSKPMLWIPHAAIWAFQKSGSKQWHYCHLPIVLWALVSNRETSCHAWNLVCSWQHTQGLCWLEKYNMLHHCCYWICISKERSWAPHWPTCFVDSVSSWPCCHILYARLQVDAIQCWATACNASVMDNTSLSLQICSMPK